MGAITKACKVSSVIKNTGKECDAAMVATAMLLLVPKSFSFTDTDLLDPELFFTSAIHAARGSRVFPLFGQQAPIKEIGNDKEADVLVTLDDGSKVFLRYGFYNKTYKTTSGGICFAQALASLNKSGYSVIEIDQLGQMLVRDNGDGTYGGLNTDFIYAPSPDHADFKSTPYKNAFMISYSPIEFVNFGTILAGGSNLLAMMGLIDTVITKAAAATTTKLKIGVETECAQTDLVALFGDTLGADVTNFIITNKATGVVVTPSAAAIVGGVIELTGTYSTGQTYTVKGAAPSVWLANDIEGYDASDGGVDILIP